MKWNKWFKGAAALLMVLLLAAGCQKSGQPAAKPETPNKEAAETKYPEGQIEYVVPFSPGGGVDLVARAAADYLSKEWGQEIVVVNKPGGGGIIGAEYALKQAKNDGYTVLANNVSNTSMFSAGSANPSIKNEDQVFTARIGEGTLAFAVKGDAPWKDFKEFSDWVKENPEKLTWTSVGPAGFSAFGVAEWLDQIGVDFKKTKMVVTKGASDSVPKVAGGHAILAVHTVGELYTMAQSGKVKILAVGGTERSEFLPDVPTAHEQGIKGLTVKWWTGVSLPKGTPPEIIKKWEAGVEKMSKDKEFIKKLTELSVSSTYANSKDFTEDVAKETDYYTELAEKGGIRK